MDDDRVTPGQGCLVGTSPAARETQEPDGVGAIPRVCFLCLLFFAQATKARRPAGAEQKLSAHAGDFRFVSTKSSLFSECNLRKTFISKESNTSIKDGNKLSGAREKSRLASTQVFILNDQKPQAKRSGVIQKSLLIVLASLLTIHSQLYADQYKSEVRTAPGEQAPLQQQDIQKQLLTTTDPYAKSMLLRDLAAAAARKGDSNLAAKYLEQALATHGLSGPAEAQMRADLGELRMGSGDPKSVIAGLEPQYRANPNLPPEQLIALGAAYLKLQRYKEAVGPLQRGVAATRNPDITWRRGLYAAYIGNGQEREAAQVLETVVRDQPTAREDWLRLAALHEKLGDIERAQAVMEVASRLGFLDSAEQRMQLVTLTAQIGAPFQAGSLLHGWLEGGQVPRSAANLRAQAALWIDARESTLAIPALEDALKASPSADLWLQLGQLYMDREDYKQAGIALEKGITSGGKNGAALMALGVARYQQADVDGAVAAFEQAETIAANAKLAAQWVAYLQSGRAREQALAAAASQRPRDEASPRLDQGLLGEPANVQDAASEPAQPGAVAANAASGSGGFTPIGAEQAGNREGSIPPWTGGLTRSQWPLGFHAGGHYADPFANEQPLFTITAANAAQYAAHLSDAHRALLKKFPDYTMPVYATHRSAAYPQAIYDASQANIGKAKLIGADAIADARLGVPFPHPDTGVEAMWNHRLRYRGDSMQAQTTQAVVNSSGTPELLKQTERVLYRYGNVRDPANIAEHDILLDYLTWFGRGANGIDFVALVHETANSLKDPRAIWVIPQGIPKMFRVPPVGYDQPFPGSGGLYFLDMLDMYNGLFDRYVWKLTGKRELYIPYNAYRLNDGRYQYSQLLTPNHFNQQGTRYELHRVWVIEANERGGMHHSFGKRVFYLDEDSWNVVLVENYDHDGNLWRFQEGHLLSYYDVPATNCAPVITYDFKDGRYFANRLDAQDSPPRFNLSDITENEFSPEQVKSKYVR